MTVLACFSNIDDDNNNNNNNDNNKTANYSDYSNNINVVYLEM